MLDFPRWKVLSIFGFLAVLMALAIPSFFPEDMAGKASAADRKLAYLDVEAAWRAYRDKYQAGRGVVLIGHSQGAGILKQLLAEVLSPTSAKPAND